YAGHAIEGNSSSPVCDGQFSWAPSVTSSASSGVNSFAWSDGGEDMPLTGDTCDYSVYIPSNHAGGLAKYFVYGTNLLGHTTYLFNHTVDQEATSGWVDLGTATVPLGDVGTLVTLDNIEPTRPGWDVAFDAVAFDCSKP